MIGALAAFYIRRDRNTAREWKAQPRGVVVDNFGGEILEGRNDFHPARLNNYANAPHPAPFPVPL